MKVADLTVEQLEALRARFYRCAGVLIVVVFGFVYLAIWLRSWQLFATAGLVVALIVLVMLGAAGVDSELEDRAFKARQQEVDERLASIKDDAFRRFDELRKRRGFSA